MCDQEGRKREGGKKWRSGERDQRIFHSRPPELRVFSLPYLSNWPCNPPVDQGRKPADVFALLLLTPYTPSQHLDVSVLPSITMSPSQGSPSLPGPLHLPLACGLFIVLCSPQNSDPCSQKTQLSKHKPGRSVRCYWLPLQCLSSL